MKLGKRQMVVVGPPGTGKTTTLLQIVESELSRGVPADQILLLSFSRAAAREAKGRVEAAGMKDVMARTIHSKAFELAGRPAMLRRKDLKDFGRAVGVEISDSALVRLSDYLSYSDTPTRLGDAFLAMYSYEDATMGELPSYHMMPIPLYRSLKARYEQMKESIGRIDYTDQLKMARDMRLRYRVVIVDEGQDLSRHQWYILRNWAADAERVYIAGDDDQAIYQYGGADPESFCRAYVAADERKHLDVSYRLPDAIIAFAQRIGERIGLGRIPKAYRGARAGGGIVRHVHMMTAVHLAGDNLAHGKTVLWMVRNWCFASGVARALADAGIAYQGPGAPLSVTTYRVAADAVRRLRALEDVPSNGMKAIVDLTYASKLYDRRGDRKRLLDQIALCSDDEKWSLMRLVDVGMYSLADAIARSSSWLDVCDRVPTEDVAYLRRVAADTWPTSAVVISSIHQQKGREADVVIVNQDITKRTADNGGSEEHRIAYVAATRAKEALYIVTPQTRRYYAYPTV